MILEKDLKQDGGKSNEKGGGKVGRENDRKGWRENSRQGVGKGGGNILEKVEGK